MSLDLDGSSYAILDLDRSSYAILDVDRSSYDCYHTILKASVVGNALDNGMAAFTRFVFGQACITCSCNGFVWALILILSSVTEF